MGTLDNPALPGDFDVDTMIYASAGFNYSGVPALEQYLIYDSPHPEFVTGRRDISAFAKLGIGAPWPFHPTERSAQRAHLHPARRGPFPLVMFAHGNHRPLENSTPGYLYLCRAARLARHHRARRSTSTSSTAATSARTTGAAIVHLEHVKQFRTWNATADHPLHRKVDLNRIADRRALARRRRSRPRVAVQPR